MAGDRYDPAHGPATEARVTETIQASDGALEATVTVEATGPETRPAAELAGALAAANRTVVDRVFSAEPDAGRSGPAGAEAAARPSDGSDGGENARLMDWGGHGGGADGGGDDGSEKPSR